ncbi:MAG: glycosyltransferase family 4 protein [Candidatus Sumerlaeota bacterium]|nr:glycosyltransferase family 4 protein [Candidatus Sumerlaeota bacterium]
MQLFLLARELARSGAGDVHFIVHGDAGRRAVTQDGVTIHFTPFIPGLAAKMKLQRLLTRIGADCHIVRGMGSVVKEVAFFCLWRRRKLVYWIAHEYDVNPSLAVRDMDRNRWFEWGMLRANLVIAQTQVQAAKLKQNYGRDCVIIPNSLPARTPSEQRREFILWVGRFVPFKRPDLFIELARRLPQERCVMIAPVPQGAAGECFERHRDALKAAPNIEHIPGVPLKDMDSWFDRAKVYVNTSSSEGFPNTFLQAAWAGTPIASLTFDPDGIVAACDMGVAPVNLRSHDPKQDMDAFAAAIAHLLSDETLWRRQSQSAYACAQERHDLGRNAALLSRQLDDLLRKRG